jgi:cysteinyl-tRNA synthetase
MILEYLGENFDLHSGGVDLVFPHHENEIAQSCCATHGHFASHWFHITHLMVDGGKMSKSLGNLYTLQDLAAKGYSAAEVRYVLVGAHYRQPLNFTFHSLDAARQALQKLAKSERALAQAAGQPAALAYPTLIRQDPGPFAEAWALLNDDLNVPGALGAIFGTLNKTKPAQLDPATALATWTGLHLLLVALGLTLPTAAEEPTSADLPPDIITLAEQRWQAKQNRDWATADALRQQLDAAGYVIKDAKDSYQILPK